MEMSEGLKGEETRSHPAFLSVERVLSEGGLEPAATRPTMECVPDLSVRLGAVTPCSPP